MISVEVAAHTDVAKAKVADDSRIFSLKYIVFGRLEACARTHGRSGHTDR